MYLVELKQSPTVRRVGGREEGRGLVELRTTGCVAFDTSESGQQWTTFFTQKRPRSSWFLD